MGKRILPDGTIVDENDPRAKAQQRPAAPSGSGGSGGSSGRSGGGGGIRTLHGGGQGQAGAQGAQRGQPGQPGQQGSPLDSIAAMIGIQGRTVPIPAVAAIGVEACEVPLVHFVLVAVLSFFFGWRVIPVALFLFFMSKYSERPGANAGGGGGGGAGGRAGGGGGGGGAGRRLG